MIINFAIAELSCHGSKRNDIEFIVSPLKLPKLMSNFGKNRKITEIHNALLCNISFCDFFSSMYLFGVLATSKCKEKKNFKVGI